MGENPGLQGIRSAVCDQLSCFAPPPAEASLVFVEKGVHLLVGCVDSSIISSDAKPHGDFLQQGIAVEFGIDKPFTRMWEVCDMWHVLVPDKPDALV
jgi:hypothetical protein